MGTGSAPSVRRSDGDGEERRCRSATGRQCFGVMSHAVGKYVRYRPKEVGACLALPEVEEKPFRWSHGAGVPGEPGADPSVLAR